MTALLPPLLDYDASRRTLLARCEADGAVLEHHVHPLRGPGGVEVATDVARFGAAPGGTDAVVVVASGTHGVEGHTGWGLQALVLDEGWHRSLPPRTALLFVAAINPYGMAWSRRVDADNIDVNRNFVDFAAELPANPRYAELDPVLNPVELDPDDRSWEAEVWGFVERVGIEEGFRTLSGGQYEWPAGVQFGGQAPSWSRRTLDRIWRDHLADAHTVVNLDVHSGLGPCGVLSLFQTADEGEEAADAARSWFPTVLRSDRPGTSDPLTVGVLGPGLDDELAGSGALVVPVVVEFGTRDVPEVFSAMRADNWLHNHGEPTSPVGDRIRAAMRDAFFVDDEGWRRAVADDGLRTVRAALDAVAAPT